MAISSTSEAWAVFLSGSNNAYLAAVLVLNQSLKDVDSRYPLIALVTSTVDEFSRSVLKRFGIKYEIVQDIESPATAGLLEERWAEVWSKLQVFECTNFSRLVLLDADLMFLKNADELMTMHLPAYTVAAVHQCTCNVRPIALDKPPDWRLEFCYYNIGNPAIRTSPLSLRPHHTLNSGVVVLRPSKKLADATSNTLKYDPVVTTFTMADQDVICYLFRNTWQPLDGKYNAHIGLRKNHTEVIQDMAILHWSTREKPWHGRSQPEMKGHHFEAWWSAYDRIRDGFKEGDAMWKGIAGPVND